MQKNDKLKLKITDYDGKSGGIGRINDFVVFVDFALPNETVLAEITEVKKHFARAKILEILEKSSHRIAPFCQYYGTCGGCDLQHCDYDCGLELKTNHLKRKIPNIKNAIGMQNPFNYRNTAQYKIQGNKIGFYAKNSHDIVDITSCPICHADDKNVLSERRGGACPSHEITTRNGHLSAAETISFMSHKFNITPKTFFQTNYAQTEKLYNKIIDFLHKNPPPTAIDLYCGVGSISITIASHCKKVYGIELVPESVKMANENAVLNNIPNIEFICSKAETSDLPKTDVIIVDPPRSGLSPRLIENIQKNPPKTLIYVSCNPQTFLRDIALFTKYRLTEVQPIDMFPWTRHLELTAKLQIINTK